MEYKAFKIGNLSAKFPLVQGGIEMISTDRIGLMEQDYDRKPTEANLRALETEIQKAKELAEGGIVGVNIVAETGQYERYVEAACKAGADLIVAEAGVPVELPKLTQGYDVKIAPIVSSVKAAGTILKMWRAKYNRMPDMVVIEGAGGGYRQLKPKTAECTINGEYKAEICRIMAVVDEYADRNNRWIPVVVADGVSTTEEISEMLELGVDGVQIVSRFVTTFERDASREYKVSV